MDQRAMIYPLKPHFQSLQHELEITELTTEDIAEKLKENDMHCEMKSQPDFPVLGTAYCMVKVMYLIAYTAFG